MAQTTAEAHNYQTKKPNSKTQYTTSTDQHKSTKKKGFYKAFFYLNNQEATSFIPPNVFHFI